MSVTALTPAQVAALRRAAELSAELSELAAAVRAALREPPRVDTEDTGLAAGELGAAFAAAAGHARRHRRPRELFGR